MDMASIMCLRSQHDLHYIICDNVVSTDIDTVNLLLVKTCLKNRIGSTLVAAHSHILNVYYVKSV